MIGMFGVQESGLVIISVALMEYVPPWIITPIGYCGSDSILQTPNCRYCSWYAGEGNIVIINNSRIANGPLINYTTGERLMKKLQN